MRILVTGASGLLGLNFALEAAQGHTVLGQVNRHGLHSDTFSVLKTDLLTPGALESLLEQAQPDWVVHCAALALVDECESDPGLAHELNTVLPAKLAQLVARGGARLLHVSTDAVFDGQKGDYREDDTPNPLGVYARSKLEGERAVATANPEAIIARVNLFGWSLLGRRSLGEFFFNNLSQGKPCKGFTDVIFCPMLANHLAQTFLEMMKAGLSGLYHTVSSECLSKYEFGVRIAAAFGLDAGLIAPVSVEEAGLKAARSPNLTVRTDKLAAALGHALPSVSTGIAQFSTLYQQGYPQQLRRMVAD